MSRLLLRPQVTRLTISRSLGGARETFQTEKLRLGDGTAALPSLCYLNDTDTGLYRPGDDILGIATAGTEAARFDALGNLSLVGRATVSAGATATPGFNFAGFQTTGLFADANGLGLSVAATELMRFGATGNVTLNGTGQLILPQVNLSTAPTLAFGDGNSGFYEAAPNFIRVSLAGAGRWDFTSGLFGSNGLDQPAFLHEDPSNTNPNIVPSRSDDDTGVGRAADDELSLIAGGVEGIRVTEASGQITATTAGGRIKAVRRITDADSPYTVLVGDHRIVADTDAAAVIVLLPAGVAGTEYEFVNSGSSGNDLTITPNDAELLGGANSSDVVVDGGKIAYVYETTEGWW